MKQGMIFFDIDGTLLDHEKKLALSTKRAIQRLKDIGHEVAIATGRAPYLFQDLREELEIDTYVSFNGQYVVVKDKVIFKNPLSQEGLTSLSSIAKEKHNPVVVQDHQEMRTDIRFDPEIEECVGSLKFDYPKYDPNFLTGGSEVFQAWLFCKEEDEDSYINTYDTFDFIRWHEFAMDVVPKGGSKAHGINQIISHLDIEQDQIFAFGDGLNDIDMLTSVKNSVAMGNATDKVKNAAKYVTKNVDEDGIAYGLEMVGLL